MKGPRHALRPYFIFIAMRVTVQKIAFIQSQRTIYTKPFLTFNTFVTARDVVLMYPTQYLEKCTMFAHYKNILYL